MSILACLHLCSCDVHEFPHPEDENISFVLHLKYDTNMPFYKTIECTEDSRSVDNSKYDVRYIVYVYPELSEEPTNALYSFVFTKNEVTVLDNSVTINLKKGAYKFMVWTDYVTEGSQTDNLYDTNNFGKISPKGIEYQGNSDLKDAFKGTIVSEVSRNVSEAVVEMVRPVAKFKFITDDIESFISQLAETKDTSLDEFKLVFRYNGYLANSFNMYTDQSSGSLTEETFFSTFTKVSDIETLLGFDYVFAELMPSSVYVTLEICNKNGEVLSSFSSIEVPLVRGKLSTVIVKFTGSQSGGGAAIDPDYNGDINIIL